MSDLWVRGTRRGDLVERVGAVGVFIGVDERGIEWICWKGGDAWKRMAERFDARIAKRLAKLEAGREER